jgi:hypothetical protein
MGSPSSMMKAALRHEEGIDDEGVGREGQTQVADADHGLVVQPLQCRVLEGRQKQVPDERLREPSAAAVSQEDLVARREGQRAAALLDRVAVGIHGYPPAREGASRR